MALTLPWSQGSIQVGELRSQKPHGAVKKKKNNDYYMKISFWGRGALTAFNCFVLKLMGRLTSLLVNKVPTR